MRHLIIATALLAVAGLAHAKPKCEADTFSGKQACVYGTGTIGIAGIGNQIITREGQMFYRRNVMTFGDPLEARAFLFRIDDRRTVKLSAENATRPNVSCTGKVCTWSWTVMAPLTADVLTELASAKTLVMAVEGKDGRRTNPETMKKGGQIFAKLLADIRSTEENVLNTSVGEAYLQQGDDIVPYSGPTL